MLMHRECRMALPALSLLWQAWAAAQDTAERHRAEIKWQFKKLFFPVEYRIVTSSSLSQFWL